MGRGGKKNVSKDGGGGGGEKIDEIDFTPVKQGKGKVRHYFYAMKLLLVLLRKDCKL